MRLIRDAWTELWRGNRGGGVLTLAFWYTVVVTLYQYFVASRLGPSLPHGLVSLVNRPGTLTTLPHLSASLWLKIILVYLTFVVIILPYTVGGLYGGIATVIRERPQFMGFFAFFRYGYLNFWRALGQIVAAVLYGGIVLALMMGIFAGLSAIGANNAVVSVAALIVGAVIALWLVATLLYWFGRTFGGENSCVEGFVPTLRWGFSHLGQLYGQTLVLLVVLLAALYVVALLARIIPVFGPALLVLAVGMVAPAFLAIYAILLFQQSVAE